MKHIIILFSTLLFVCSCEKTENDPRDSYLNDIAGEYYLVDYNWGGADKIDINNNGNSTESLLPIFTDWSDAESFSFKIASNKGIYNGVGSACIPAVLGETPTRFYPGLFWLNFKYTIDSKGISFPQESIEILTPEVCSTQFSNPHMEFCHEHESKDIRYLIITMDAHLYDYSCEDFVDGRVRLQFVAAPYVSVNNGTITAWGN